MAEGVLAQAAEAAHRGDLAALKTTLQGSSEVLTARDGDGRTLLDLACRSATGNIAIPLDPGAPEQHAAIETILQAGADPNAQDSYGWTPLHTAGMAGHAELARRLIGAGASVAAEAYGQGGGTPLSYALFYAKPYMGNVLMPVAPDNLRAAAALGSSLDRFVDNDELMAQAYQRLEFYAPVFFPPWQRSKSRQEVLDEALTWASRNDQCDAMARLVALGADVNANPFRGTALLWACYADKVKAATWLLDHGADPDVRHGFGGENHGVDAVAMHLAAQHNAIGCLELLLDRGADPSIVDGMHGGTPLGWAEHGAATEAVELLKRRSQ